MYLSTGMRRMISPITSSGRALIYSSTVFMALFTTSALSWGRCGSCAAEVYDHRQYTAEEIAILIGHLPGSCHSALLIERRGHAEGYFYLSAWLDGLRQRERYGAHRVPSNQTNYKSWPPRAGPIIFDHPGFDESLARIHRCVIWDGYIFEISQTIAGWSGRKGLCACNCFCGERRRRACGCAGGHRLRRPRQIGPESGDRGRLNPSHADGRA